MANLSQTIIRLATAVIPVKSVRKRIRRRLLADAALTNAGGHSGKRSYFVTDTVANFANMVELFLGAPGDGEIRRVDIDAW